MRALILLVLLCTSCVEIYDDRDVYDCSYEYHGLSRDAEMYGAAEWDCVHVRTLSIWCTDQRWDDVYVDLDVCGVASRIEWLGYAGGNAFRVVY